MTRTVAGSAWTRALGILLFVGAAGCYVGIVIARQGPPSGGDTVALTAVTSDLASGRLGAAAANDSLPNPPGYPLLVSPLVAAFPSLVGPSSWCTTGTRASDLRSDTAQPIDRHFAIAVGKCGVGRRLADGAVGPPLPPWYRAQGVLGLLSWVVLALGALSLLHSGGVRSLGAEAGLLAFLAFLPAASSAIVQLYHPQDIVSLGLGLGGLAQMLRGRWIWAGTLFGVAVLTKQFAVLLLVPALAAAPDGRSRLRMAVSASVVFGAGILPFLVANPRATLENLSGFSAGGAVAGTTALTLIGVTGTVASAVARDAPVVVAVVGCFWAARRFGSALRRPPALVALALACMGSRLVFESVIFPYYLLGTSVLFVLLDLIAQRSPHRSLAWSAAAAFFVAVHPTNRAVDAFGTLFLAVLAVAAGILDLTRAASPAEATAV
jgi:Glycosyltransferase family 87